MEVREFPIPRWNGPPRPPYFRFALPLLTLNEAGVRYFVVIVMLYYLCRYWRVELQRRSVGKKPRLLVAILRCLWFKMVVHNILFFVEV